MLQDFHKMGSKVEMKLIPLLKLVGVHLSHS